jgi:hypothetical protein
MALGDAAGILPVVPTVADYPELVAQFDRRRNRPITPETISYGSARKVWWKCPKGPDHRWQMTPNARTHGGEGCPFCAGKRVSITNALATRAPALAAEWHPTKNRPATPETTVAGTNRKVWWRCKKRHVWAAVVSSRFQAGAGCPYCSHRRTSPALSLAVLAPGVASEWHPTKNGALTPHDVLLKSNRRVWWKCPHGDDHEWSDVIHVRTHAPSRRTSCPFCGNRRLSKTNLLSKRCPEVAAEWHPTKNGALRPDAVTYRSMRRAWWRCAKGHAWSTRIYQRTQIRTRCPYCAGTLVTPERSLAALGPEIAAQWHPTRNGSLGPADVTSHSSRRVWWKCPAGDDHEFQTRVGNRFEGGPESCPFCAGKRVSKTNSLASRFPKVARQWHPTKNGTLTPKDVTSGTERRVWWRCVSGHEWQAPVLYRTQRGYGCAQCRRHEQVAATTGRKRRGVRLARYEGPQHGPVRRGRA